MKDKIETLSFQERIWLVLRVLGITGAIMLLFYRSLWGILLLPLVFFFETERIRQEKKKERENLFREAFLHGIGVLNHSLQAGFSMENAWREVERETKALYGSSSEFYHEIKNINQRVAHNLPIEKLILEMAYRCRIDDVIQFAELMEFGKRSGSDWKKIIDVTVGQMMEKNVAVQQIEVMVAEKKMEQQVMNIIPLGLLGFLQFFAWDYLSILYHNWFGVIAMTIFLIGYVLAILLSKRILKVEL